jgi:CDP-4-dehydro-6-deoxyglucose reductase
MHFFESRVIAVEPLSANVRLFRIKRPDEFFFSAGQFVMFDLPIKHEFTTRSYSIASAPQENGYLDFWIVYKPDGVGTHYLFNEVKVGDTLRVSEAQGKFLLKHEATHVCFICTGTGIAPFASMIKELGFTNQLETKRIALVFGNRTENDILMNQFWLDLSLKHVEFKYLPVLSRPDSNWLGLSGYVHAAYEKLAYAESPYIFYLCGWSTMVKEAKNNLRNLGFDRKRVKFELYD